MGKTRLYFTRHGQTQWNVEKRAQGHQDSPLTELGIRQATWLRDALLDTTFTAIYSSSSQRAYRTAEILRAERDCALVARDDLREINLGAWEGKTGSEIRRLFPTSHVVYSHTPHLYQPDNGGESLHDVQTRAVTAFNELAAQHEGETILVVTHGVMLKTLFNYLKNQPMEQIWQPPFIHPTALNIVALENGCATIELYGDISHYPPEEQL